MISAPELPLTEWTLDAAWRTRLAATPNRPFLNFCGKRSETFLDTYENAARLARSLLCLGVKKGDRVVIYSHNSLTAVHAWMAANLIGAVDVPINPALRGQPLEHAINLAKPTVIIAEDSVLSTLKEIEGQIDQADLLIFGACGTPKKAEHFSNLRAFLINELPDGSEGQLRSAAFNDIASIMLTSGTSGPAKGVLISHAQAFSAAKQVVEGLRLCSDDVHYCCQPLFHMSPRYFAIYGGLLAGTEVWIDREFSAEHWIDQIRRSKATVTIGHGPLLEMIFDQPQRIDDGQNNLTRIAAAPFPKHIADGFEERFGLKGIEAWGMTEIGMPCWQPYDEPRRIGSCGRIRTDLFDFAVVNPDTDEVVPTGAFGEFVVRAKHPSTVSPGYFCDPASTVKAWRNLWFHTGDGGYIDADGWVYFVDRLKDRIRRRAENISSYDIEHAVLSFPNVDECAAVGVPSEYSMDDDIKLFVVQKSGHELDARQLLVHVGKLLPHYMVPRYIEFVETLPRTPTQKIRRSQLRSRTISASTWDRKSLGVSLRELLQAEA